MTRKKSEREKSKFYKRYKTKSERVQAVRDAMVAGHSNRSAAKALGTTRGTIAGIRRKHDIPTTYQAPVRKPLERPTLAAHESVQCTYEFPSGQRCAYKQTEGSDRCPYHPRRK